MDSNRSQLSLEASAIFAGTVKASQKFVRVSKITPGLIALFALLVAVFPAFGASLDELVAREEANRDNESVLYFGGKVGKLDAIFIIEWDTTPGNTLQGSYYNPARGRDRMYRLSGKFVNDRTLILQEFTPQKGGGDELSATCRLTKRVTADRIIWEGTMNNTDGRKLDMMFSRKR